MNLHCLVHCRDFNGIYHESYNRVQRKGSVSNAKEEVEVHVSNMAMFIQLY